MRWIKSFLRNIIWTFRRVAGIDTLIQLAAQAISARNREKKVINTLAEVEFRAFSQWGEDGIIDWLVTLLDPKSNFFLEFGVEDYRESNTRYLLTSRNWKGVVIDGDPANIATIKRDAISYKYDIDCISSFITAENIRELMDKAGLPGRLGLISMDIDGVDWWVLRQIDREADIFIVEYNDFFGNAAVSVPYRPDFVRGKAHWSNVYWGASLNAYRSLLEGRGYLFVGTNSNGTNAFFVHGDHAEKCRGAIAGMTDHPCRLRDSRNRDGSVANLPYREFFAEVESLPVILIDSGEQLALAEVLK